MTFSISGAGTGAELSAEYNLIGVAGLMDLKLVIPIYYNLIQLPWRVIL
jgi:hypothetical protein